MNWWYGLFGMFLVAFAVDHRGHVAPGMRPYEAIIGGALMVVAMLLNHRARSDKPSDRRSTAGK